MRRHLGWIAIAGFAAAAILLVGAWFLSGGGGWGEIARRYAQWNLPRCADALAGKTASREIAWIGGESAAIGIPATLRYSPGTGDKVTVAGDASLISHVFIDRGEIKLDCRPDHMGTGSLDITLPGAHSFRTYSVAGNTTVILSAIDQPVLNFNLAGSSSVSAAGRVDSVHVNGAGMSSAKLGGLAAQEAHLNLVGASMVEVAAEDTVEINSVGAATVTLRTEPRRLQTHIVGSGQIIHPAQ